MGQPYGIAEGGAMMAAGMAVISGRDPLRNNRAYINQIFVGYSGGPALHGYDGWLTYNDADTSGMLKLDSIEIDEGMYPILVEERRAAIDSLGSGRWDGAPAMNGVYRPTHGEMSVIYCSDGDHTSARGVLGGRNAMPSINRKRRADGSWMTLPSFHTEICMPSEAIGFRSGGGGGYGDPLQRDPERVAASVNRGWLSRERAEQIYKVALTMAPNGYEVVVDVEKTRARRGSAR
jgi:N-methylhydantoinase B